MAIIGAQFSQSDLKNFTQSTVFERGFYKYYIREVRAFFLNATTDGHPNVSALDWPVIPAGDNSAVHRWTEGITEVNDAYSNLVGYTIVNNKDQTWENIDTATTGGSAEGQSYGFTGASPGYFVRKLEITGPVTGVWTWHDTWNGAASLSTPDSYEDVEIGPGEKTWNNPTVITADDGTTALLVFWFGKQYSDITWPASRPTRVN